MLTRKIGIDLGTTNTLLYVPKKGIVINEPSIIAVVKQKKINIQVLAIGDDAKSMIGRAPDNIIAYKPLRGGVIADYKATQAMLNYFIDKITKPVRLFKPEIVMSVPASTSSSEKRVIIEAAIKSGAKKVYLLQEPIATAIGSGVPIEDATGHMIVNIGGGTTEAAVISLGGIVCFSSVKVGGDNIDEAITKFVRKQYKLAIGEHTAEQIKINSTSALPYKNNKRVVIEGSDIVSGLPKILEIELNELTNAIQQPLLEIILAIKRVLQKTPPQLASDVIHKGILLSGGTGKLKNLDRLINKAIGIECRITEEPLFDVIKGVGRVLNDLSTYNQAIWSVKH